MNKSERTGADRKEIIRQNTDIKKGENKPSLPTRVDFGKNSDGKEILPSN